MASQFFSKNVVNCLTQEGYGNFKTARTCFPTSVTKSAKPPVISRNYLEYNGAYYTLGEGHKNFVAEMSMDEDNYVLTLAAIAKELRARGLYTARIHLAVGLPLKWHHVCVKSSGEAFHRSSDAERRFP
jgi:hypothetical protein